MMKFALKAKYGVSSDSAANLKKKDKQEFADLIQSE